MSNLGHEEKINCQNKLEKLQQKLLQFLLVSKFSSKCQHWTAVAATLHCNKHNQIQEKKINDKMHCQAI